MTEGFFVRIDSEVARLARATAEERKIPLREACDVAMTLDLTENTMAEPPFR